MRCTFYTCSQHGVDCELPDGDCHIGECGDVATSASVADPHRQGDVVYFCDECREAADSDQFPDDSFVPPDQAEGLLAALKAMGS